MPNWCENYITISGDEKVIDQIVDILKTDGKDDNFFETLIGRNPEVLSEDYENQGWYEANISWYGTKWDISIQEVLNRMSYEPGQISFTCETAWAPPVGFMKNVSEIYNVEVSGQFYEPGMDFAGQQSYENGVLIDDFEYTYEEGKYFMDRDYFWESLESNLEYYVDSEMDVEEVKENFSFMDDEDIQEVVSIYEELKSQNEPRD